jgi:hypothetical protein
MNILNVLIAVDATKLAQQVSDGSIKCGSKRLPTPLESYGNSNVYLVMLSQYGCIDNNTESSDLLKMFDLNDIIQWSITSFANNFDHSLFLYKVKYGHPVYQSSQVETYLPAPGTGISIGTVTKYTNQVATVNTKVLVPCSLQFQLVDNATGNIIGYFKWNPFINAN